MLEANEGVFAWGLQSGWSRGYRWWHSGKFVVSVVEQDERAGRAGRRGSHRVRWLQSGRAYDRAVFARPSLRAL